MPLADLEPLLPEFPRLRPRASEVVERAFAVGRHLHPATLDAVRELLRTINCYYSNLIEGHDTHPVQIERAMEGALSRNPVTRDLQREARAHIEVQRAIEARMIAEPSLNVCARDFLAWVHGEFYARLPEELRIVRDPDGAHEKVVVPGALRDFDVRVGHHIAPRPAELPALLDRFAEAYEPARLLEQGELPLRALVALGAAHHRLLYIHPFGDGNGRVTRLMTDAWLRQIGVGAHGLWTASRGLARQRARYRELLANADQPRWNDLEGRGARSLRGLNEFCEFFLSVCEDQLSYMAAMLAVDGLTERFIGYCRAREIGAIAPPGPHTRRASPAAGRPGRPTLGFRPEATRLLRTILAQGPVAREEVEAITGLADRTARRMVSALLGEGLLASASSRAPLRLRFPAHAAPYVFPDLYGTADGLSS